MYNVMTAEIKKEKNGYVFFLGKLNVYVRLKANYSFYFTLFFDIVQYCYANIKQKHCLRVFM